MVSAYLSTVLRNVGGIYGTMGGLSTFLRKVIVFEFHEFELFLFLGNKLCMKLEISF